MKTLHIFLASIFLFSPASSEAQKSESPDSSITPESSKAVIEIISDGQKLVNRFTSDKDCPLALSTLLVLMADEGNADTRHAIGAIINRTVETAAGLRITLSSDAILLNVTDPAKRKAATNGLKGAYSRISSSGKASWETFRPKLSPWERHTTVSKLITDLDSFINEVDKLAKRRLAEADLQG